MSLVEDGVVPQSITEANLVLNLKLTKRFRSVLTCQYLAAFQFGLTHPLSILCYGAVLTIWFDAWRRVFKRP